MNKRKLLLVALALSMVAILAVGGTLAYFTDIDAETNVFTVGDVKIDLYENFEQNSVLRPSTGSAQAGTLKNGVTKEVFVTNTGSEDAYVRVHIAIPAVLDNGDPTFDAGKNVLHFNYDDKNIGADQWDWSNATGAPYEGQWNYYETEIDGIAYNVYVVTYEKALKTGEKTVSAMNQVYLDSKVTNEDIDKIKKGYTNDAGVTFAGLGENWKIYVVAEGAQKEGFDDAYAALDAAFGKPGTYQAKTEWKLIDKTPADPVDNTPGE